ncbi:helix-turn-helix transcriptional regulator [Streptomyces sp. NPDC004232]|uniref:helix-turn-helix domain-containing protein n=1 Tax=Streptomyces sp. NPDC004232 TaxID=3154454 RepID=UPI0033B953A1
MKAIREARGISLRQLAKDIGRDPGFLSRVEDDQQGASDETLRLYATYLRVPTRAITHKETPSDQERPGSPHRDPQRDDSDPAPGGACSSR